VAETISLALGVASIFPCCQVARPWVVEYLSVTFNVGSQPHPGCRFDVIVGPGSM
jgi:hypothetical protein